MRDLSTQETTAVTGALTNGQITYYVSSAASAVASFTFNMAMKRMGISGAGKVMPMSIEYLLKPAINIFAGAISTEACTRYLGHDKKES